MTQGESSHLPLKLNTAGVIPPIFASSLLLLPATLAGFSDGTEATGWITTVTALLRPWAAGLHGPLRRRHYLLCVLLHGYRVQSG